MNDFNSVRQDTFDFPGNAALFESILSRRIFAFVMDLFLVLFVSFIATVIFLFLGLPTLGLTWFLIPAIYPVIVLVYIATTIGGERASTIGMRSLGLEVRMFDGEKPNVLMAVFHTLAFYVSISVLTPLILLIGLFTRRQRLLHDYVSGIVVLNGDALPAELSG